MDTKAITQLILDLAHDWEQTDFRKSTTDGNVSLLLSEELMLYSVAVDYSRQEATLETLIKSIIRVFEFTDSIIRSDINGSWYDERELLESEHVYRIASLHKLLNVANAKSNAK